MRGRRRIRIKRIKRTDPDAVVIGREIYGRSPMARPGVLAAILFYVGLPMPPRIEIKPIREEELVFMSNYARLEQRATVLYTELEAALAKSPDPEICANHAEAELDFACTCASLIGQPGEDSPRLRLLEQQAEHRADRWLSLGGIGISESVL